MRDIQTCHHKTISIRKMRAEDAEDISTIYAIITKGPSKSGLEQLTQDHICNNDENICVVAEVNGKIAGFMISYILPFGFGIEKSAWIATMGVDPKYMGQGIGEKMAMEIFNQYKQRGISCVGTSVQWDSTDLLSFFKTLGFDRSDFINLAKTLE